MPDTLVKLEPCRLATEAVSDYRTRLPRIAEAVIDSCSLQECHTHVDYEPIPSRAVVVEIIDRMRELLFPGYFSRDKVDPVTLRYSVGQTVTTVFDLLAEQICRSIRHDCLRYHQPCVDCDHRGHDLALQLLEGVPDLRRLLSTDVRATYEGDPAARSHDEIIFSYPGLFATAVYRVAHRLYRMGVPLLPRIMTEHAHSVTGIDIHPGAEIDESFVIDHGTGVVIGETTRIGKGVRIYQGVTLGALSLPQATRATSIAARSATRRSKTR